MYAAIGGQTHKMHILVVLDSILIGRDYFLVIQYRTIGTSTVYLDKVLLHYTSCTDIEVTHLRVAHLSVRQTYVLTACFELATRVVLPQAINIWGRGIEDYITLTFVTASPTIEDHQKSFLCHSL